ncbi:unnamed protein product [Prorocentrum cordatum]|uniref:Uncharacterized protein n=1 Tax=Prorocentrum cordatum TaxID=2364126 RepID=A0ABN9XN84_9DINO|nr:unnamed protein product [Polarella glacialis]
MSSTARSWLPRRSGGGSSRAGPSSTPRPSGPASRLRWPRRPRSRGSSSSRPSPPARGWRPRFYREAAAATSQLEAMRQELLKRQRETLSEVSALLDDAKRAVAAVRPAALPDDGADAPGPALPAGADAAGVAPGSPGRVRRQSHLFAPAAAGAAAPAANVEPVIGDVVREPRRAVSDVDSEIDVNDEDFSSTAGGRQLWGKQMSDMNLLASDPEPRPESHALLRYLKVGSVMLLAVLLFGVIVFPYSTAVCLCTACLWLLYLCGEEQLIRTVERRQSSEGGCSRKMTVVARALRKVQGLRSSRSKEFYMKASLCALSGCERGLAYLAHCMFVELVQIFTDGSCPHAAGPPGGSAAQGPLLLQARRQPTWQRRWLRGRQ